MIYSRGNGALVSQIVLDSCKLIQKTGATNYNVYLASPAASGSQIVWRNTYMSSFINPIGIHSFTTSTITNYYFGEYLSSGAGSYASNAASRASTDTLMTASDITSWSMSAIFASPMTGTALTTSWVDSTVLAAIAASNAAETVTTSSSSTMASTSTSSSASSASTVSASSTAAANATVAANSTVSATATTTTASASATCDTTTFVVNPTPAACQYANITAALAALPNDGLAKTVLIWPGTYTERISNNRTGKVTLRGNTTFANDYTQNQVTIQYSLGYSTSLSRNEETPVLYTKKTDGSGLALYNINFVNTFPQTSNTAALAADFYGGAMAAYGCKFVGFQDTLLVNQGVQFFYNSYIEGSVDFIWGYSKAYFLNCVIASNTAGAYITAQNRPTAAWAGGFVFDNSIITTTSSYVSGGTTYLGRPWSEFAIVVYKNSYLGSHINAAGWATWSSTSPNTGNVVFGEYNNTVILLLF